MESKDENRTDEEDEDEIDDEDFKEMELRDPFTMGGPNGRVIRL